MTTYLNGIALPDDLQWLDEFTPRVIQSLKTSLDATPHITAIPKTKGLPITLSSWDDGAFVTRATVLQLQDAARQVGYAMPLLLRDQSYSVMFRHHDGQAFSAEPVRQVANPGDSDWFRIKLLLMTV